MNFIIAADAAVYPQSDPLTHLLNAQLAHNAGKDSNTGEIIPYISTKSVKIKLMFEHFLLRMFMLEHFNRFL
jgi:hypothetical protein